MSKKRLRKQQFIRKLYNKRRLIILNEDTLEETFSFKLNAMNVFVVLTLLSLFLIGITTYIIAFTPLREYIPGYASTQLKKEAYHLAIKTDSLEKKAILNESYISSIKKVLIGEVEYAKLHKDSLKNMIENEINEKKLNASEEELELRKKITEEDKYNVFDNAKPKVDFVLFSPAQGTLIKKYNISSNHLGVSIALVQNTPIKSIAAGIVVFSEWTSSYDYVVIIRHKNDMISVYKNLASITKKEGNVVNAQEVIALSGVNKLNNKSSTLYFELWKEGFPLNPLQYINFN